MIRSRAFQILWAFLFYLACTLVLAYPVVRQIGTVLPNDPGDPVLNTWILWWSTFATPLSNQWWNAWFYYPAPDVLTFSENLLGVIPISAPTAWATGSPVVAYNVTFLLSFALSGTFAWLLCGELSDRQDAALIAGLAYAFCPYRIDQLAHLQVLASFWLPLVLFALHRYVREGRVRWLVLFVAAYVLQGLANGYFLLFVPILVLLWTLWFVPAGGRWSSLAGIAAAGAISIAILAPVLLRYQAAHEFYGFVRSLEEIRFFSADVTSILAPAPALSLWGFFDDFRRPEGQLFPGLVLVGLIVLGIAVRPWPRPARWPLWRRMLHGVFAVAAGVELLALVSRLSWGPWEAYIIGIRISVDRIDKLGSVLLLCSLAWVLSSPAAAAAWSRGLPFPFYVLASFIVFILALGPVPTFAGEPVLFHAPYGWLLNLPGFDGLRVPPRFWMLAALCLAVAGGLAFQRVVRASVGPGTRWGLAAIVGLAITAEGWVLEMPAASLPPRSAILERAATGPVLELPAGPDDLAAMYRSIFHHRPVANGYSGHFAPHYFLVAEAFGALDPEAPSYIAALGVRDVLIRRQADSEGRIEAFVAGVPGVEAVARDEHEALYRLPAASLDEKAGPHRYGAPLPIMSLSASINDQFTPRALDNDRLTRWETGPQRQGDELTIDLGAERAAGAVVLELGPSARDYPRVLSIELSSDGVDWSETWRGRTWTHALLAIVRSPRDIPLVFPIGRSARYIRLKQLGEDPVYYWSVAELRVLAQAE
jgi:MFS family permease